MAKPRDFKKTRIGLIAATAGSFGLALTAVVMSGRTGANAQTTNPTLDPATTGLGGWTEAGGQTRVVVVPWPTSAAVSPATTPTPVPQVSQGTTQQRTVVVVPRTRVRTRGS